MLAAHDGANFKPLALFACLLVLISAATAAGTDVPPSGRVSDAAPDDRNETDMVMALTGLNLGGESNEDDELDPGIVTEEDNDNIDSDISEERNPHDEADKSLADARNQQAQSVVSHIGQSFSSKKSFSCPKIKTDLKTGGSIGDLSPEDIKIIASIGDGVPAGAGIYSQRDLLPFRGASFATGGDASIDGLVTLPNILREFSPGLLGISHGMGAINNLPSDQLSMAELGAFSRDMPKQALALVNRLKTLPGANLKEDWVMVIVAVGTEEMCATCDGPSTAALRTALTTLKKEIEKGFVVLLGPVRVTQQQQQHINLLKTKCACMADQSMEYVNSIEQKWKTAFDELQDFINNQIGSQTFGVMAFPALTITSRYPSRLFITKLPPFITGTAHGYASKWLWNRLIAGDNYNLSSAVLSSDAYFCPSTGCPYFRTTANFRHCVTLSLDEAKESKLSMGGPGVMKKQPRRTPEKLYTIALSVIIIAFFVVIFFGVLFYNCSKKSVRGRFEEVDEEFAPQDSTQRKATNDENRTLIRQDAFQRQSTRSGSAKISTSGGV